MVDWRPRAAVFIIAMAVALAGCSASPTVSGTATASSEIPPAVPTEPLDGSSNQESQPYNWTPRGTLDLSSLSDSTDNRTVNLTVVVYPNGTVEVINHTVTGANP